jgi:hypothetical protein
VLLNSATCTPATATRNVLSPEENNPVVLDVPTRKPGPPTTPSGICNKVEAAIDVPVIAPVEVKDDTLTALPAVKLLTATLVVTPD